VRRDDWSKILGWPGYTVYRHEIDEKARTLKLWVRRKRGNRRLICSGCGRRITAPADITEREVRDLPCFQYRTTVVIELYRVRCPDCGLKIEKVGQLPSKAPFSKRFEEAVGEACESASARRVAKQFRQSICVIWNAGMRSVPSRPCGRWAWMRSIWEKRRNSSQW
jgi:transposase